MSSCTNRRRRRALCGRRFVALCYRTVDFDVRLSVCNVGVLYCGQMVGWIKMKLGMHVGFGPGHTVLDGDPAPSPKRCTAPNFRPMSIVTKRSPISATGEHLSLPLCSVRAIGYSLSLLLLHGNGVAYCEFVTLQYSSKICPCSFGVLPELYSQNVPLSKRPVVETSQSHNVPSQNVPPWSKRPESNRPRIKAPFTRYNQLLSNQLSHRLYKLQPAVHCTAGWTTGCIV